MLALLVVIGLGFRVSRLSDIGFAEDEVNKRFAGTAGVPPAMSAKRERK